jgi:hypothetical protein
MIILRLITVLLITIGVGCTNHPNDAALLAQGNVLVDKIERYNKEHNQLPESLADIGIKETMEGPLYYEKKDSLSYIVWFGQTFGESKTYYSATKRWEGHQK